MAPTQPLSDLADAVRQAAATAGPSLVSIGRRRRGVGVIVAPNRVLTNAHNLRDRSTQVTFAGGRAVQARLTGADADHDLVVLDVDTGDAPALPWSTEIPETGDVIFAAGIGADGPRVTFGTVSAVSQAFRGPRGRRIKGAIEHTAPLARGSSGGPILDAEGHIVGINTHRLGDGFYLALAADDSVRERVDKLAAGQSLGTRRLGIQVVPAEQSARMRRRVGLEPHDGLLIRAVAEDSLAATAGLREGDLVIAVTDQAVTSIDDVWEALDGAEGDLAIGILRGAEPMTLTVALAEPETSTSGSDAETE